MDIDDAMAFIKGDKREKVISEVNKKVEESLSGGSSTEQAKDEGLSKDTC